MHQLRFEPVVPIIEHFETLIIFKWNTYIPGNEKERVSREKLGTGITIYRPTIQQTWLVNRINDGNTGVYGLISASTVLIKKSGYEAITWTISS